MEYSFVVILALTFGPYHGTDTTKFGDFVSLTICKTQMRAFTEERIRAYQNNKVTVKLISATCTPNKTS